MGCPLFLGARSTCCVSRFHGATHMKREPGVVSHLVHELRPPSHAHSESEPLGQALLQAPPDGGGAGASPICHCCVLPPWHAAAMIFWVLVTVMQSPPSSPPLLLICFVAGFQTRFSPLLSESDSLNHNIMSQGWVSSHQPMSTETTAWLSWGCA